MKLIYLSILAITSFFNAAMEIPSPLPEAPVIPPAVEVPSVTLPEEPQPTFPLPAAEIPAAANPDEPLIPINDADSVPTCPIISGLEDATVEVLREAIKALDSSSNFDLPGFVATSLSEDPTETKLYTLFGHVNYVQMQNPMHKRIRESMRRLVAANPDIDASCVLRTYLAERGAQIVASTPPSTPVAPAPTPTTPANPPRPTAPTKPVPTKIPVKPAGSALDVKPLNDAIIKLNGALMRIRNAKDISMSSAQRSELRKEAQKLLKENNAKFKLLAQRVQRIIEAPGFAGNPDKVAPFKKFVDLYNMVEREVTRI